MEALVLRSSTLARVAAVVLVLLSVGWGGPAPAAETTTYVLTDVQGTVLAREDAQGNIIARYDYRPYGKQQAGPVAAGPGYTGHVEDPDTGLVYMQQRYYDPEMGGFLSTDPVMPDPGNPFNFNRYHYASNNPVLNIDPDGRQVDGTPDQALYRSGLACRQVAECRYALSDTIVKSMPVTHAVDPSVPKEGYTSAIDAAKAGLGVAGGDAAHEYAGVTLTKKGRFWYTAPATINERGGVKLSFTRPENGYSFASAWYHTHPFGSVRQLLFSGADVKTTIALGKMLRLKMVGLIGMHQDGSIRIFDSASMAPGIRSDRYNVHGKEKRDGAEGEVLCERCFP